MIPKKYKAECDKTGVIIHFKAMNEEQAWKLLMEMHEYRRAFKKHKATKNDWILEEDKNVKE